MTTHKLTNGYTLKVKPTATEQKAYIYKEGETMPECGTHFSQNKPLKDIIEWANDWVNSPQVSDFEKSMTKPTEQPKMYRLKPEFAHEYAVYSPDISYLETHKAPQYCKL